MDELSEVIQNLKNSSQQLESLVERMKQQPKEELVKFETPKTTLKRARSDVAKEYNDMPALAKIITWPLAIAVLALGLRAGCNYSNTQMPPKRHTMFEQSYTTEETKSEQTKLNIQVNFNVPYQNNR